MPSLTPAAPPRTKRARRPAERRALLLAALFWVAACGAEPSRARVAPTALVDAGPRRLDAGREASEAALATTAEIAATAITSAPGMREAARLQLTAPVERSIARAGDRDLCARAAFAATAPVDVSLVDAARVALVEQRSAQSGVIGTGCVGRGGTIAVRIALPEGGAVASAPRVNVVAWTSP